jgi:hypothetical protein
MKGWLDNFGKADNANESNVSLPEGFVGLGYDTKGRNYSPAWGGQFEQGGIIPIAQNGVSEYMKKRIQEEEDNSIAAQYNLPEVVVQGYKDRNYSVFDKAAMMPEYTPVPTFPYLEKTKDPAEFFKSWITSPEYRRRKIETDYQEFPEYNPVTGYGDSSDPYKGPLIDKAMRSNFLELEKLQKPGAITYDPAKRSEFFRGRGVANVNPKNLDKEGTVKAHEIAHAIDTYQDDLSQKEVDLLLSSVEDWNTRIPEVLTPEVWRKVQLAKHVLQPHELRADLNALRFLMYDKDIYDIRKGEKFTKEHLERAKEKLKGNTSLDRTLMVTGDDNLINLMNIIAKKDEELTPIAMNGASMPGSVGFTYARVAGAAPSKGKYAKKTMASAQNGIMTPMLLAKNVLNYFYPGEEATSTVGAAPVEYKKGLTDELLKRQAYKESTFNPAAVSPAGYKGLTQIGEGVLKDYSKKKGGQKLDPFNPKDAVELQKFAMDDLYNASFINKPDQPDSVRLAKTLAAYNWGRGNLFNYLNEQKQKGVDIYDSYDWLNDLPKETSDYVNKILLQEDQSFNKNYKRDSTNPKYKDITSLYDQKKFGGDIPSAQNGQEMRFYQNGLDWKPKSMQDGGDEIKFNPLTNEFELPEIVVEGKDERIKEAMSQGINKFYGHVGELMGAPQREMMQFITGKEQTPSQAFGFQNTGGWLDNYSSFGKNAFNFGMDAFADPLNLVGVGIIDDLTKGAIRLGAKQAADTSVNYLTTKTPLRNTYKINPFAVKEPDVILTRTQKPGQTDELRRLDELESKKASGNIDVVENYIYNQMLKSPVSRPGYGRGFSSRLADIDYYSYPNIQATRGYEGFPEILKTRLPAKEAKKFNVGTNPVEGYVSYAPGREFLLPKDLVYSAESFIPNVGYGAGAAGNRGPGSINNFIRTADAEQRIANTPNWLRGYPSVANKSSDVSKSFKSEIDWGKWNPDTPKYPELIKEYNKIEEATKKAGTWMQNPDGSVFKGTPEQFIQQQSSYFKKAYPQGYNEVYRGVSTNTSFPNFNESADPGLRGPRGIFTANKELASNYIYGPQGWQEEKRILTPFDPDNTPGLFELIYPKGKQITRYQNLDDWTNIDLARTPTKENIKYNIDNMKSQLERRKKITEELSSTEGMSSIADHAKIEIKSQEDRIKQLQKYYDDFDSIINDEAEFNKMKNALGEQTTTDTIAKYIPNTKLRSVTLQDLIDSGQGDVTIVNNRPGNYLKSMVGNVGFFDLKNPNVYKGIVPAGIATSLTFDQQRNGGKVKKVKKFQEGGTEKISINDPRYPELYKNRQVGAYYDGAFTLPDLPEVTVTAPRSYTMDSLRDFTTAALYGAPATAIQLESIPQAAMTEGIEMLRGNPYDFSNALPNFGGFTSNQRDLSQTLGYENPQGFLQNAANVGLSMIDPAIIGALSKNVVKNVAKGIGKKAISQVPSPQMMADNVLASATPNTSTVTNQPLPYTELDHPHMDLLQELKQETIDRLSRPEGKRRLQNMINENFSRSHRNWGKPVEGWGEFFLHGLKSGQLSGYKKLTPDDIIEDLKKLEFTRDDRGLGGYGYGAWFGRKNDDVFDTPLVYMGEKKAPYDVRQLFAHEVDGHFNQRHVVTNLDDKLSKLKLKDQPDAPNPDADLEDVDFSTTQNPSIRPTFITHRNYFPYGSKGMEKLPYAADVRRNLFERGIIKDLHDEVTPEMLKKHYEIYKRTKNKYDVGLYEIMEAIPDNFKILSEVINEIPAVALPIAGGAAATISALQNQQPVQKQRNGGITKDNQGYWNPDNWGKPVEIDSNDITMEGVNQPLLGISDTGDTKLMKPGKNYKFKGKKVTEFPVAKLGINQLDAQPMKKLNQLLNFTNNPDKDNWLDKYN